jgi:hypothetical protein
MPAFDQYAIYPEDRTLRLIDPIGVMMQSHEVVRVGSRKFEELLNRGYKIRNPHNASAHHRRAALGVHRIAQLVVPGYSLANELVGGHGSHSRRGNPGGVSNAVGYALWEAVRAMKKRAREVDHPELVKVIAEADAQEAYRQASSAVSRGSIPSRFTLGVFGVTDRPRVYGYAPERWIEEESDKAMDSEHERLDRKSQEAIDRTAKIAEEFKEKVRRADERVQEKIAPELDRLEEAVDEYENSVEESGPDSYSSRKAASEVKSRAEKASTALDVLTRAVEYTGRKAKGAYRGALRGWRGDDITWGPGIRGGK